MNIWFIILTLLVSAAFLTVDILIYSSDDSYASRGAGSVRTTPENSSDEEDEHSEESTEEDARVAEHSEEEGQEEAHEHSEEEECSEEALLEE